MNSEFSADDLPRVETEIACLEDPALYRGYPVAELVENSTFSEVTYLLLHGELPDAIHLADFGAILAESVEIPPAVFEFLQQVPFHAAPWEVLRTALGSLAVFDPQPGDGSLAAERARATRLVAQVPVLVAAWYRGCRGEELIEPTSEGSFPGQLVELATGAYPEAEVERAIDALLVLTIDVTIGPAALAARAAAAGGADVSVAVIAAAAAEPDSGRSTLAADILDTVVTAARSRDPVTWAQRHLEADRALPGFLSGSSPAVDPRTSILTGWCRRLAEATGRTRFDAAAGAVEVVAAERFGLVPRLEWPAVRLMHLAGLDAELHMPMLAVSRLVGWATQAIEQRRRPVRFPQAGSYVGPATRRPPPLDERG